MSNLINSITCIIKLSHLLLKRLLWFYRIIRHINIRKLVSRNINRFICLYCSFTGRVRFNITLSFCNIFSFWLSYWCYRNWFALKLFSWFFYINVNVVCRFLFYNFCSCIYCLSSSCWSFWIRSCKFRFSLMKLNLNLNSRKSYVCNFNQRF